MENVRMLIKSAKQELDQAEINFNNAQYNYIDVAIHEYNAKLEKFQILLKEIKEEEYVI